MRDLTGKEKIFVAAYLVDLNAYKAARKAKYRQASSVAYKILARPEVQVAITAGQARKMAKFELDADHVVGELMKIAFTDIRKAVRWGRSPVDVQSNNAAPNGLGIYPVELVPSDEVDDNTAKAIASVKVTQTGVEIRMHDKNTALIALGKHFGIFREDVYHHVSTPEEVKRSIEDMTQTEAAAEWLQLCADPNV